MSTQTEKTAHGLRPSRRTIAKGAAWAAPVVAIGAAAPAASASTTPPPPKAVRLGVLGQSGSVGDTFSYTLQGFDSSAHPGAEYPDGTTITFTDGFTIDPSSLSAGATIISQAPPTVSFPAGVMGFVSGTYADPGTYSFTAAGPAGSSVQSYSGTSTVSPAAP
ncbi:hypothetical protein [Flexivirga caeni]|uniref:hypothetical protein n=1 Tax=Flexivirga caeni TaxID=2294115 RepID=UPI0011CD53CA|nr:hypothetical protein [Flexivirga caeni]